MTTLLHFGSVTNVKCLSFPVLQHFCFAVLFKAQIVSGCSKIST